MRLSQCFADVGSSESRVPPGALRDLFVKSLELFCSEEPLRFLCFNVRMRGKDLIAFRARGGTAGAFGEIVGFERQGERGTGPDRDLS